MKRFIKTGITDELIGSRSDKFGSRMIETALLTTLASTHDELFSRSARSLRTRITGILVSLRAHLLTTKHSGTQHKRAMVKICLVTMS